MAKFSDGPSQMTSGLKSHGSGLEVSGFRRVILELCRNAGHLPNLCGHLLVVLGGNSGSTDLDRRPGELRATHQQYNQFRVELQIIPRDTDILSHVDMGFGYIESVENLPLPPNKPSPFLPPQTNLLFPPPKQTFS